MREKVISKPQLERIASIDFLRGFAIFFMTFAHCFYHVYDYKWVFDNPQLLFSMPKILLALGLFIAYLGSWNSFFLLLSITVNTLGLTKNAENEKKLKRAFHKKLLTGFLLIIFGEFIASFGYYGYFGYLLQGKISWKNDYEIWSAFFGITTIKIIGWSVIITSTITYLLLRNNGNKKYLRNVIIYTLLALIVLVSTPFVQFWVDSLDWKIPPSTPSYEYSVNNKLAWPNEHVQAYNAGLKTWLLVLLAGDLEPFFPCLATAFVGAIIGMTLAQKKIPKHFIKIGLIGSVASIIVGAILILLGVPYSVVDQRIALPTELIQLGGQVITIIVMLWLVEFRGRGEKFANNRLVRYFRKWSIITLSIFWLEIFDIVPKWTLNLVFGNKLGINFYDHIFGYGQLTYALLVAMYSIFCYDVFIRLWAKINFAFGFEWFLLRIQGLIVKQYTPRLDVDLMLNHIKWISYYEAAN